MLCAAWWPSAVSRKAVNSASLISPLAIANSACARHSGATEPLAYRAEQGVEIGRGGFADVQVTPSGDDLEVRVGGEVADLLRAELRL